MDVLICIRIIAEGLVNQESIPCDYETTTNSALITFHVYHASCTHTTCEDHILVLQRSLYFQCHGINRTWAVRERRVLTFQTRWIRKAEQGYWMGCCTYIHIFIYIWSNVLCAPGSTLDFQYVYWVIKIIGISMIFSFQDHQCMLREMAHFGLRCNVCSQCRFFSVWDRKGMGQQGRIFFTNRKVWSLTIL